MSFILALDQPPRSECNGDSQCSFSCRVGVNVIWMSRMWILRLLRFVCLLLLVAFKIWRHILSHPAVNHATCCHVFSRAPHGLYIINWLSPQDWLKSLVLVENPWKGATLWLAQNFIKRKGALLSCLNFSLPLIISANQANQQPQMTVGKIYCAKLIYENYKFMRRKGQIQAKVTDESCNCYFPFIVDRAVLMFSFAFSAHRKPVS